MAENLRRGDKVRWKSHGGEAVGEVEKKITEDTEAAGRKVRASQGDPQYLVKRTRAAAKPYTSRTR
jgi:Hypervirulence associated proteins TUDOR domain